MSLSHQRRPRAVTVGSATLSATVVVVLWAISAIGAAGLASADPVTDTAAGATAEATADEPAPPHHSPKDTTQIACPTPLDFLTRRQRIAQLFTVGVSSMEDARRAVETHSIGGIFLGSNVVAEAVNSDGLRELHADSALPLLVAIDEEGGRVSRIAPFAGPLPSARVMGTTMSPEQVRTAARDRGTFLRTMGVTVDFAPSLDVSEQPDGAVIGDRSFSADPLKVAKYARAFAAGLLDAGITPVFKHFPGHGRSSGDSHHQAVTVPPIEHLVSHDLVPFARLADMPGTAMMLGHQQVPGLTEPGRPASLSPAAYRLLREGSGYSGPAFNGPVFTDDLSGMRAVTDTVPLPRAVATALSAGADSPLWISTAGIGEAVDAVHHAVTNGTLGYAGLDRSLTRMATLRGIPTCPVGPVTGRMSLGGSLTPPMPDPREQARELPSLPG